MKRAVTTNVRLAAERQIHAAIAHFRGGDFECAITLCSAAEGRIPSPSDPGWLREVVIAHAAPNDDFNFAANWLKHDVNPDDLEIEQVPGMEMAQSRWRLYSLGLSNRLRDSQHELAAREAAAAGRKRCLCSKRSTRPKAISRRKASGW